jgi:hypothetical protein
MTVSDSCAISPADLVGGWFGQAKIRANGLGTWDKNVGQNSGRPAFTVKSAGTCGSFDFSFPDDRVYRGDLAGDRSRLTFSRDNVWPKTSNDAPPTCSIKWPRPPTIFSARTQECVSLAENFCAIACVTWGRMTDPVYQERWKGGVTSWEANGCGCQISAALGQDTITNGRCNNPCASYSYTGSLE